ncbi:SDR family NAD(P)-dependent oxidoreductase [Rhodanobacter sp. AS-Z3]|uniref:SDR family NAD(P)-dependent oxidoreductase n=1 Tax=Rhodanobacter sp. AS-Z3 TaxID=3031330 RepID=UPI00247A825E|nr:SDR family oxidoreductase [Rhodanobacter sp. AS-Z3]WEN14245.1 SDR family NAD(P)-dependent oxidoreductase [Rhodanobacter sp. AS-Z3]
MTQTVWITGASGAIGQALAHRLSSRGCSLALSARDPARLQVLASTLPGEVVVLPGDLTDASLVPQLLDEAQVTLGPITGLAHCVGSTLIRPLHLTSEADLRAQFELNYFSAFHVLKAFVAAALKHKQSASAVLVGTLVARSGFPNHEAIASAKAAVAALAMSAAASYAEKGIRVNCVHPGLTRSALSARLTGTPEALERNARMNPMGLVGEGEDSAAAIDFLLSEQARWITAQQWGVDGGHAVIHPLPKG